MPVFLKKTTALLLLLVLAAYSYAQQNYPQNYYTFPIKPGQRNYLSGKMGELRSNHFHGGLDIKTEGREGLKVHATADGYIYRIKVSSYGYGKVLYMQHPNGQKSVYAHLQQFDQKIEDYVLKQQYQKEDFFIELFPSPNQFTFKRGEVIALSGNSGSSGGPHLHFEIRNANDEPLKTLRFGFPEIVDQIPAEVRAVALRTKDPNARINGEFGRVELPLVKTKYSYQAIENIKAIGWLGIDLYAFDKADGVHNKYGIYDLTVEVNGKLIHQHLVDHFSFFESRSIHTFTDYAHLKRERQTFQRAYIEDGNSLPFFPMKKENDGKIFIEDGEQYDIVLRLKDVFGNTSKVLFTIVGDAKVQPQRRKNALSRNFVIDENTLVFHTEKLKEGETSKLFIKGHDYDLRPAYEVAGRDVFIWDMREGLPDSITWPKGIERLGFDQTVPATIPFIYSNNQLDITFSKTALYDTLYLQTTTTDKGFQIQDREVPLFKRIQVNFRPTVTIDNKAKTRLYSVQGRGRFSYEGGYWRGNQISFSTRTFGEYVLKEDTDKPTIDLVRHANNQIVFKIKDNTSGIKSFRATLNGKWLLMRFDHRKDMIWSDRFDKTKPLKGEFRLVVTDNVGNETVYEATL